PGFRPGSAKAENVNAEARMPFSNEIDAGLNNEVRALAESERSGGNKAEAARFAISGALAELARVHPAWDDLRRDVEPETGKLRDFGDDMLDHDDDACACENCQV